jgi:adenylate kinase
LVVLLFGPPGCGKGTQAAYLARRFAIPAISTGEMFRAECKAGTDLGRLASSILAAGKLVGDDIVNRMVASRISRPDCAGGFLLDGYPRTVPQARFFASLLKEQGLAEPVVIHLDVPDEVLVSRITARRQCPQCLRIYNLISQPPAVDGQCDRDGARLLTREDDQEAVIRQRLRAYEAATRPILEWYGPAGLRSVDGSQEPAHVADAIEEALAGYAGLGLALTPTAHRI